MKLIIKEDCLLMSERVANHIANEINSHIKKCPFVLQLSTVFFAWNLC